MEITDRLLEFLRLSPDGRVIKCVLPVALSLPVRTHSSSRYPDALLPLLQCVRRVRAHHPSGALTTRPVQKRGADPGIPHCPRKLLSRRNQRR